MLNITFLYDTTGINLGDLFLVECQHIQVVHANLFTQNNQESLSSEDNVLGGLFILEEGEVLVLLKSRLTWIEDSHVHIS
jgi:hypothetical protein